MKFWYEMGIATHCNLGTQIGAAFTREYDFSSRFQEISSGEMYCVIIPCCFFSHLRCGTPIASNLESRAQSFSEYPEHVEIVFRAFAQLR